MGDTLKNVIETVRLKFTKKRGVRLLVYVITTVLSVLIIYGLASGILFQASVDDAGSGRNALNKNGKDSSAISYIVQGQVVFTDNKPANDIYICFASSSSNRCYPTNDTGGYFATLNNQGQVMLSFQKTSDENVTYHVIDNPESNYFVSESYDNFDIQIAPD